ncbi:MAG TPA: hypothetical protein VJ044_15445 [Candidatus Hodarchaeales archaeon]|nr:hypothetical protein [Candidatus Hodarchaeales archaeon]
MESIERIMFNDSAILRKLREEVAKGETSVSTNSIVYLELGFIFQVRDRMRIFPKLFRELKSFCFSITKETAELGITITERFKDDPRGAQYFFRDSLVAATVELENLLLIT